MLKFFNIKLHKKLAVSFILFLIIAAAFFIVPDFAYAGDAENMLFGGQGENFQAATGLGDVDIRIVIARIIRYALGFLGIVAVSLIIYGGWLYMTSQGDEGQIATAKKVIINSMIGMVVILSSFAIASFILNRFLGATGGIGAPSSSSGVVSGLGATGNSTIESHYPLRNQKGVPRNTMIVITFKEPMNVDDLIDSGNVNSDNVLIYRSSTEGGGPFVTNVTASVSADNKTFRFDPVDNLGSPSEPVEYTIELTSAIQKANGEAAFAGAGGGYAWSFEVSTVIDVTPPKVISVLPVPSANESRNVVVQINFNEPIDPTSASGATGSFDNIVVTNETGGANVDGNFYISNQYRTVEFLTEDACGVNSCGDTIYCLPGLSDIKVLIKAGTLVTVGEPMSAFPYDGVVDMASNSLDGNMNGVADGPQAQSGNIPYDPETNISSDGDDYNWSFSTNNSIIITAPEIDSIAPDLGDVNVSLDTPAEAIFNRYIMSSSLTKNSPVGSGSVALYADPLSAEVFFWLSKVNSLGRTAVYVEHEDFLNSSDYFPEFNSGIMDIYQNCYSPSGGPSCVPNPPAQPYCCDGVLSASSCAP